MLSSVDQNSTMKHNVGRMVQLWRAPRFASFVTQKKIAVFSQTVLSSPPVEVAMIGMIYPQIIQTVQLRSIMTDDTSAGQPQI